MTWAIAMPIWGKSWSTMQVTNNETRFGMQNQNCIRGRETTLRSRAMLVDPSPSPGQPVRQRGREPRFPDALLRRGDVVGNAQEGEHARGGIEQHETGARIAVARLA